MFKNEFSPVATHTTCAQVGARRGGGDATERTGTDELAAGTRHGMREPRMCCRRLERMEREERLAAGWHREGGIRNALIVAFPHAGAVFPRLAHFCNIVITVQDRLS